MVIARKVENHIAEHSFLKVPDKLSIIEKWQHKHIVLSDFLVFNSK